MIWKFGGDLLSRAVTSQVPSALKGLTAVFGMGTGGTPSPLPPKNCEGAGASCATSIQEGFRPRATQGLSGRL